MDGSARGTGVEVATGATRGLEPDADCPLNAHLAPPPNNIHEDGYTSDVSPHAGILGADDLDVELFSAGTLVGGICTTFVYTRDGAMVTLSLSYGRSLLLMMDTERLRVISKLEVPKRNLPPIWELADAKVRDKLFRDVSGGAYFFLDDLDRVVLAAADGSLWIIDTHDVEGRPALSVHAKIPLLDLATRNVLVGVMPDHAETASAPRRYWYATTTGAVGLVELGARGPSRERGVRFEYTTRQWHRYLPEHTHRGHAPISNSFSVNPNGAFLVTCSALYRLEASESGIEIVDRYAYARPCESRTIVPGRFSIGSGTTPTLMGLRAVAIGDGDLPMNVIVCDQRDLSNVARIPVMGPKSACELSFIVHGDEILAVNNYGYTNPLSWTGWKAPGTAKVRVTSYAPMRLELCERWEGRAGGVDTGSSTPKLSLPEGVVYAYAMDHEPHGGVRWHLFGLDFRTGERVVDVPVYRDRWAHAAHDNAWGIVTVGPRNTVLVGMWRGFLRVRPKR
jgi:hypothetical protein